MPNFTSFTFHFNEHPMDADFDIRYTDRPITPFGGLTTVKNFYQTWQVKARSAGFLRSLTLS